MGSRNEYMGRNKRFNKKGKEQCLPFRMGYKALEGASAHRERAVQAEDDTSRRPTTTGSMISNREEVLYNRIWKLLIKSENLAQLSYSRGLIIIEGVTYLYDTSIESKELCKRD